MAAVAAVAAAAAVAAPPHRFSPTTVAKVVAAAEGGWCHARPCMLRVASHRSISECEGARASRVVSSSPSAIMAVVGRRYSATPHSK